MSEFPKVTLTAEQWGWMQEQEHQRTMDVLLTNQKQRDAFTDCLRLLAESVAAQKEPEVSLRDWFAGQALVRVMMMNRPDHHGPADHLAMQAYEIADAMLEARK